MVEIQPLSESNPADEFIADFITYLDQEKKDLKTIFPNIVYGLARAIRSQSSVATYHDVVTHPKSIVQEFEELSPSPSHEELKALHDLNVVVFGANAGIGVPICLRLQNLGAKVRAVIRKKERSEKEKSIRSLLGEHLEKIIELNNICHPTIEAVIKIEKPDVVINCIGTMEEGFKSTIDINVGLALEIANAVKKANPNTLIIQFCSAIVPYGLNVHPPYYRSKAMLSKIAKSDPNFANILAFLTLVEETGLFDEQKELERLLKKYSYQKSITPDWAAVRLIGKLVQIIANNTTPRELNTLYIPFYLRLLETLERIPWLANLLRKAVQIEFANILADKQTQAK